MEKKKCTKCGKLKPSTNFRKTNKKKSPWCKKCREEWHEVCQEGVKQSLGYRLN
jgi:hypothetical protein